jgi:hypothetical protein
MDSNDGPMVAYVDGERVAWRSEPDRAAGAVPIQLDIGDVTPPQPFIFPPVLWA